MSQRYLGFSLPKPNLVSIPSPFPQTRPSPCVVFHRIAPITVITQLLRLKTWESPSPSFSVTEIRVTRATWLEPVEP